jgi:hypothetical protein
VNELKTKFGLLSRVPLSLSNHCGKPIAQDSRDWDSKVHERVEQRNWRTLSAFEREFSKGAVGSSNYFHDCRCLKHVQIGSGSLRSRIDDMAFSGSSIESIFPSSTVEFVRELCFAGCKSLSTALLESGSRLRSLVKSVFFECSALQSFRIPSWIEKIGDLRLRLSSAEWHSLSSLEFEFGSKLRPLGAYVVVHCAVLRSICIPSSLSELKDRWSLAGFRRLRLNLPHGSRL